MLFILSLHLKGEAKECSVLFMCQEEGVIAKKKQQRWGSKWTLKRSVKIKEKYLRDRLVNKLFVEKFPLLLFGRNVWAKAQLPRSYWTSYMLSMYRRDRKTENYLSKVYITSKIFLHHRRSSYRNHGCNRIWHRQ